LANSVSYLDIQEVSPGDHVVSAGALVNPGDSFCLSVPISITLPTFEVPGSVRVGNNAKTKIRKKRQNLVRQARHREKITPKIQQENNPQLPHSAYHNTADPSLSSSPGTPNLGGSSIPMRLGDAIELTVRKTVPVVREVSALVSFFKAIRGAVSGKSDWRDYHVQPRTRFAYPTDLKYVQSRTDYEVLQMYNQFSKEKNRRTSLFGQYYSTSEILQRAWSNTKFCEFECNAQQLLIKRFEKEEQKREAKQKREKAQRQAQLKKRKQAEEKKRREKLEKVQQIFLDHEAHIEVATEQMYEKEEYLFCEKTNKENIFLVRHQQRIEAFETALADGFQMQYKAYRITQKTGQLLQQQNIDVKQFESCTGNAIQQQFHTEFVNTLNSSADLKNLNLALDKDLWFLTIGNLSQIGSFCNNIGQIGATQRLSDICFGLYQLGSAANLDSNIVIQSIPNELEDVWTEVQNSLIAFRDTWKAGGDAVSDFMSGVQQKAFGRPAEYLSQFLYALKHNPEVVFKKIGDILLGCAQCSLETAQLLPALACDPFCIKTTKLVFEFDQNWIIPLLKKIEPAGQAFYEMSFKEKSQEVVALGMQVVSAVGIAKLSAALAAEASLGWTTLGLKLNQLSQTSASTFNTTIPSGGGATVVLPAVEVATEEYTGAAGQMVTVGTDIGAEVGLATEVATNVVLAANYSGPERQNSSQKVKFFQGGLGSKVKPNRPGHDFVLDPTKRITTLPKHGATINGRYYTQHALERMAENTEEIRLELAKRAIEQRGITRGHPLFNKLVDPRGIHPSRVEEVIRVARRIKGKNPGTWNHTAKGLKVVLNEHGDVITVFKL